MNLFYLMGVIIQTLLAAVAGWILWKAWRRFDRRDATVGKIVGAGLILRSFAAQILFWVSYLGLPVARPLQDGNGFWKFAIDSEMYFSYARKLIESGWHDVVLIDRTLPSPVYLQFLSLFLVLFGFVVSVGAFLNLFAYLICCEVVLRLGRLDGSSRLPTLIAFGALTVSPSLLLWSTQPLKDALFISMVALFLLACSQWRWAWQKSVIRWGSLFGILLLLLATMYTIAGIRWYFGILLCAVAFPFLVVTVVSSRRRVLAGIANLVLFVLLLQMDAFISGPYLPRPIARLLMGSSAPQEAAHGLVSVVEKSREGFDLTGGKSQIQEGTALARVDRMAKPASAEGRANSSTPQAAAVPRSAIGRIAAGMVAVVVPRFLSESLGLIHVGGGSGLWPVVEADTLLFDLLILVVIFQVIRAAAAGGLRDPSVWLVGLMTGGIAILLTYTISNFGTLFRHRSMILLGLALLLAVSRGSESREKPAEPVT